MYSLSFHVEADLMRRGHNRRDPHAIKHDKSIDPNRIGDDITLIDTPLRQAYKYLFGKSLDEYNRRARKSRRIDDYYTHIAKSQKHLVYEAIVQLGSVEQGSPENAVDVFLTYVNEWADRNPNMYLVGAYIHLSEATPHLHISYVPFAESTRGMRLQNSLSGALKAQGIESDRYHDTAQIRWEQSERDALRDICRDLDIDLLKQGHGRKRHYTVDEYKALQDDIRQQRDVLSALKGQESTLADNIQQLHTVVERQTVVNNRLALQERQLTQKVATSKEVLQYLQDGQNECMSFYSDLNSRLDDLQERFLENGYLESKTLELLKADYPELVDLYTDKAWNAVNQEFTLPDPDTEEQDIDL